MRKGAFLAVALVLMFIVVIVVLNSIVLRTAAQQDLPQLQKKPQLPCGKGPKTFVLEASEIEDKIKELNAEGYCIGKQHFLLLGGGKVLLLLDKDDLFIEEAEDEEDEH